MDEKFAYEQGRKSWWTTLVWQILAFIGIGLAFWLGMMKLPGPVEPAMPAAPPVTDGSPEPTQAKTDQLAQKELVLLTVRAYLEKEHPRDGATIDRAMIWTQAIKPLVDAGSVPKDVAEDVLHNLTDKDGWIAGMAKYSGELLKDYKQHVDRLQEQKLLHGQNMDMQQAKHLQSMAEEKARHDQRMAEQHAAHLDKMEELRLTKGGGDPGKDAPVRVTCSPTLAVNGIVQRTQPIPKPKPKRPKIVPGSGCKCPPVQKAPAAPAQPKA